MKKHPIKIPKIKHRGGRPGKMRGKNRVKSYLVERPEVYKGRNF